MRSSDIEPVIYHSTTLDNSLDNSLDILRTNKLLGKTPHLISHNKTLQGVSLTRSINFALNWRGQNSIVFEFSRIKLQYHHKLIPLDKSPGIPRGESEEFLVGDISNVEQSLKHIIVRNIFLQRLQRYKENGIDVDDLLYHKKLKVID